MIPSPSLSDDAMLLIECLEDMFGAKFTMFEGVPYLDGWRYDIDKLEADFQKWLRHEHY
jgi:hypothetical protein